MSRVALSKVTDEMFNKKLNMNKSVRDLYAVVFQTF